MLISPAYAQGAGGMEGMAAQILPIVLIIGVFYFLIIRPQQKKQKAHREMLSALHRGDRIVTSGGLVGTITKVTSDTEIMVEIAEGIKVRVMRGMVSDVMSRTEARGAADEEAPKKEKKKKEEKA
ncbi:MAG: preprotein translocase subunit YajC [Rhodospirillaceae bacterium]|jgi:preprotein translocase subunit YajC|nr:preprotein translocase subunit YajC [Rhodospirillaceae bacterium]MBT5455033.1 preprotein translocase subunit YajC [Rhodospirillaceae bacterium]